VVKSIGMILMSNPIVVKFFCFSSSNMIGWFIELEFLDGFRTNPAFQQQDRDKLLNLASSLSSFFDYTGITNLAQNKIASKLFLIQFHGYENINSQMNLSHPIDFQIEQ
jgi:hypothetical protein